MTVTFTDQAKRWGQDLELLQQATKRLEEVLGASTPLVSAKWDQGADDRGRTFYTLTISDFDGEVSAQLAADELQSPRHLRSRFLGLWGDLLQARSDKQVRKLQEMVTQED